MVTVHENKKPIKCSKFQCPICDLIFTRNGNLKTHIDTAHEKKKSFKCNQCQVTYGKKGNLTKHIKRVYEGIKLFECDKCEQTESGKAFGFSS